MQEPHLKEYKRRAFCSPVILQIEFNSYQDNPPAIHTLAKCYLDLLENNNQKQESKRSKLIYKNDRLVKALFINYNINPYYQNKISIKVDNITNFKADLEFIDKIENNEYKEISIEKYNYDNNIEDHDIYDNSIDELIKFQRNRPQFIRQFGKNTYESWINMLIKNAQKQILKMYDLDLKAFTEIFQESIKVGDERLDTLYESIKSFSLNPWFSINLGKIPEVEGENKVFKDNVKKKFETFVDKKSNLLFPLRIQLCITILLVNPNGNGIDLDNLARKIIPYVNDIMQPPIRNIQKEEIEKIMDTQIRETLEKDYISERKMPKYSITKYQIFEIPHIDGYDNGSVILYLGDGSEHKNIWQKTEEKIDKYVQYINKNV